MFLQDGCNICIFVPCVPPLLTFRGDSHVVNECNRFALEHTGNVKLLRLTVQEILAKGNQCRGGFEGSNSLTFLCSNAYEAFDVRQATP